MEDIEVKALGSQVLGAVFVLAVLFGAIARRTGFCTMGAVADIVTMGDWTRMRMWMLSIGVAIIGFNAMVALGWLDAAKTIYGGPRLLWLSALVGGCLFGFGMVLGSGCGARNLVRAGGGNLKSVVVLVVLGIAAFATLKGITAIPRVAYLDSVAIAVGHGQDLPSIVAAALGGADKATAAAVLGVSIGAGCIAWALARAEGRSGNSLLAGLGLGAVVVAVWWVSGRWGHVAEDPATLQEVFVATRSQRAEALSFVAPVAYALDWLMFFSDRSNVLTTGVVAVFGVIAGSAAHALASGSFRWEGFRDAGDTGRHLVGALLMGVGGVTALGCTVGQGLSGISTLSLGSFIAVAAIVAGGIAGVRWQTWRIEREG
jgi:uncharacterized protein